MDTATRGQTLFLRRRIVPLLQRGGRRALPQVPRVAMRTHAAWNSCLAMKCFKVVDSSAGTRCSSGAAEKRKRDTTPHEVNSRFSVVFCEYHGVACAARRHLSGAARSW